MKRIIACILLAVAMIASIASLCGCEEKGYDMELINIFTAEQTYKNSYHYGTFEKYPSTTESRLKLNADFTYVLTKTIRSTSDSPVDINVQYVFGGSYEKVYSDVRLSKAETCSFTESWGGLENGGLLVNRTGDEKSDPDCLKYFGNHYVRKYGNSSVRVEIDEKSNTFAYTMQYKYELPDWSSQAEEDREMIFGEIVQKYEQRMSGEIVFYGASNFRLWKNMEEDMKPYKVQNHGIGGSTDEELLRYADKLLYPFDPSIVFLQTGSNELMSDLTMDEVLAIKQSMYDEFAENLPNAKFVIMMALPLPGRAEAWEKSVILNEFIKEYCSKNEQFTYVDATAELLAESGDESNKTSDGRYFMTDLYESDGIHLSLKGHDIWTKYMLEKLGELNVGV